MKSFEKIELCKTCCGIYSFEAVRYGSYNPETSLTDRLMTTPLRTFTTVIGLLAFILAIMATPSAQAVLDFQEITAVSAGIEGIYIEGQEDFFIPPGTDGQLVAETYPEDLKGAVRWAITENSLNANITLGAVSGLLTIPEDCGEGWITVEAAAEGCPPRSQRIDIGCGCLEASGLCNSTAGAGEAALGSVDVRLSLGRVEGGRTAGDLFLYAEEPLAFLSTPEALVINSSSDQVVPFYRDGVLAQILTPQALVNFIRYSPLKYEVHFYDIAFRGRQVKGGAYNLDPTATPLSVWRIENPDPTGESIDELQVTEFRGGVAREFFYRYEAAAHNWSLISGNGLKIESKSETTNEAGDRVARSTIAGPDGTPVKVEETVYHEFAFGEKRIRETVDPDGAGLTTEYRFKTEAGPGYGKLMAHIDADGGWVRYAYDGEGRVIREVRPFLDAGLEAAADETVVVEKHYAPVDKADSWDERDRHRPRQEIKRINGIETARTYHAYIRHGDGSRTEITERCTQQGGPYGDPANLRTKTSYYPSGGRGPEAGKIKSRMSEAGLLTRYTYEKGRFELAMDPAKCRFIPGKGDARRSTVTHGTAEHPAGIPYQTTREITIKDSMGREKLRETYVKTADGFARIDWAFNTHDRLCHVIETLQANGLRTESAWGCCGKTSETDAKGITTRYIHDDLKRVASRTNQATGVVNAFTYDAAGRRLSSTRSNEGLSLTQESRYDSAGRLAAQVDAAGLVTRYIEEKNVSTTTLPGGATEITTRHLDGRLHSVTGTAVVARYYTYGADDDGLQWTRVAIGSEDFPRWEKTWWDPAGRVVRVDKPGFEGIETTRNVYGPKGRLIRTETPGRADTLYVYDDLGNPALSGLDVNGDGKLTPASMDRITATQTRFKKIGNDWWQENSRSIYAHDNQGQETVVSIQRQRLTGWKHHIVSEGIAVDIHGNETRTIEKIDRFKHIRMETFFYPDSTNPSQTVYVNGSLAAVTSKTGITQTFGYDALGRRVAVGDPRKGVSTLHYNAKGRMDYVADAAGNRTRYAYDPATGRKIAETNAMGKATRYAYDARGQLIRTWGDVPYPVAYDYDAYGQMVSMRTFRGGPGWNDDTWPKNTGMGDQTLWHYQSATGLLLAKEDAKGHRTTYTYGIGGALATRTWARLKDGKPLRTVYRYAPATGELVGIDYSDDTPDIVFAYDRLGRKVQVNDAAGIHYFTYNDQLQLATEGLTGQQIYKLNRKYDDLGRTAGFALDDGYDVAYGYDDKGRFTKVDWRVGDQADDVTYSYMEQSDRLEGLGSKSGLSVRYEYEPFRDVKTAVINKFADKLISRYEYQYDRLARRINVKTTGEAFGKPGFWLYGYNDRNEVASASRFEGKDLRDQTKPMRDLERVYQYDLIGNRIKAHEGREETLYQTNSLNQYADIDSFAPAYDEDGNMTVAPDGMAYTFNAENRLIAAQPQMPDEGDSRVEFVYDFIGRRVRKAVSINISGAWVPDKDIRFVYDGWNLVKEIIAIEGQSSVDKYYVWGLDLGQSLQSAGGVGSLLAFVDGSLTYQHLYDANGNAGQLFDAFNDSIAFHCEYDPFGNIVNQNGSHADVNPYRFSTKYYDQEVSLYYYGYRYYSAELGRWINRDPAGEDGGINLYAFLRNSPIEMVDILGLARFWTFSGVNNWQYSLDRPAGYTNYVANATESIYDPKSSGNFEEGGQDIHSKAGIIGAPYVIPGMDGINIARPDSERVLNEEARTFSGGLMQKGGLCCRNIRLLMVAPKTHTVPLSNSCCKFEAIILWNPYDPVPNQGLLGGSESENFWSQWGTGYTVNTGQGHSYTGFLRNGLEIIAPNQNYNPSPPQTTGYQGGEFDLSGRPYDNNRYLSTNNFVSIVDIIDGWMKDKNITDVMVCHSQGCNIAMHLINQGCSKK